MRLDRAALRFLGSAALCSLALSGLSTSWAQQLLKLEDHSLPKATIRTYHATCTAGRFATIRLVPGDARVCGSVQDGSKPPACVPRTAAPAEQTVLQLAVQLCT